MVTCSCFGSRKVIAHTWWRSTNGAATCSNVTGDAVDAPVYGAGTAAPRPGDPAVAGEDHDVETEQLGHALNNYKNFKLFSGDQTEWDEFSTKFRSQVAAGDGGVAALMESVESVMLEEQARRKTGDS